MPTTAAGHRFWEETDPEARANQQIHFFKNLSMLGGLILGFGRHRGASPDWPGVPGTAPGPRGARPRHLRREAKLAAKSR